AAHGSGDLFLHQSQLGGALGQAIRVAYYHGGCRAVPDLEICFAIADVGESTRPEDLHQALRFCAALQIGDAVAGVNRVEEEQMVCDPVGQLLISGGSQNDSATGQSLLPDVVEDFLAIRQARGIEVGSLGQLALTVCDAEQEPDRYHQQQKRIRPQQRSNTLPQQVGCQQAVVDVYTECSRLGPGFRDDLDYGGH